MRFRRRFSSVHPSIFATCWSLSHDVMHDGGGDAPFQDWGRELDDMVVRQKEREKEEDRR